MRSLSIMLVAIFVAAKAAEARASRLFNIYFLEEGQYLNPAWYGDSAFGVEEQVTETPIIPTGRRRRFGEKKVETVSMMKKPQVQDKTKRKKGVVVGEFVPFNQPMIFVQLGKHTHVIHTAFSANFFPPVSSLHQLPR
jgi:hypothetical protein